MPSDALIQQWGPIVILAYLLYYTLPGLVNQVMNVVSKVADSRATVAEAPYDMMKTMLSQSTKSDLIAIELIGIRASQTRIEERQDRTEGKLDRLFSMFEEFINKESK